MKTLLRSLVLLVLLVACRRPGALGTGADMDGWPAAPEVIHRMVLIGDGGELCPKWKEVEKCAGERDPLLDAARAAARAAPSTAVVWLGDNVYSFGANGRSHARARAVLERQVGVAERAADVTFVPGNHDWAHFPGFTRSRIDAQRHIVEGLSARVRAFPGEGGLADRVAEWEAVAEGRLTALYLDTERLLKVKRLRAAALATVREALAQGRPTVVIAHHPVVTDGHHRPGQTKLCLLEDVDAPCYARWNEALVTTLAEAKKPAFLVAGHDHTVQLRPVGPAWGGMQLVSGAAAKSECGAECQSAALPALDASYEGPGFGILDVLADGYRLTVVRLVKGDKEGCVGLVDGWSACATEAGDPFTAR